MKAVNENYLLKDYLKLFLYHKDWFENKNGQIIIKLYSSFSFDFNLTHSINNFNNLAMRKKSLNNISNRSQDNIDSLGWDIESGYDSLKILAIEITSWIINISYHFDYIFNLEEMTTQLVIQDLVYQLFWRNCERCIILHLLCWKQNLS